MNNRRIFGTHIQKLNNIVLNNQLVKEEITRNITKQYEMNKNKNITCTTCEMQLKYCLKGRLQNLNAYIKKERDHKSIT